MTIYYKWIAQAVKVAVDKIAAQGEKRVIRILECGARAGGLTVHVAPLLAQYLLAYVWYYLYNVTAISRYGDKKQLEYVFSDATTGFFSQAQKRLDKYTFIKYHTIGIHHQTSP